MRLLALFDSTQCPTALIVVRYASKTDIAPTSGF
jgi:hypothetical protein